jgi:endonuclease VIII
VTPSFATALRKALQGALLVCNRTAGPRSTRNTFGAVRFWVYGRSGKPCFVCGEPVRVEKPQRITYFCPRCQK